MTERPQPLDELVLTVVVDNETDTLSSVDAGVPQLPEMASLMRRTPPIHRAGHDMVTAFDHLCVACHGFSVLATGRIGDEVRSVLFDVGPYGDVWVGNAARLGIDLATIDAVFLSHWHWDHSGGLPVAIAAIAAARQAAGLAPPVVDLHPDRPDQRGILGPTGVAAMLPDEPTFDAIADVGGLIEPHDEPHLLGDGRFLGSGAIPRRTTYEAGLVGHHTRRGDTLEPDPLIMDERFVAAEVRGRGVTVLSACSHAGIVNACLGVRDHFPDTHARRRARWLPPRRGGDGGPHRGDGRRPRLARPERRRPRPLHRVAGQGGAGDAIRSRPLRTERRRQPLRAHGGLNDHSRPTVRCTRSMSTSSIRAEPSRPRVSWTEAPSRRPPDIT